MIKFRNVDMDSLFFIYIQRGIIRIDDVRTFKEKEVLMKLILDKIHKYSIRQGCDGRWTTHIADSRKPEGHRRITKKTKGDLYKFLLSFYGLDEDAGLMDFNELFVRYVDYKKQFVGDPNKKRSLSPSTIRRYERDYEHYIKDSELARSLICKITPVQLEEQLVQMIHKHDMNERCASNVLGYISQALAFARRSGLIDKDPSEDVDRMRLLSVCKFTEPAEDSERVLMPDEIRALHAAVLDQEQKHPKYMPNYAIELAMCTGMRVGEISALRWTDIQDDGIHVDFSEHRLDYSDRPSELVIGEPKNGKHRVIPMSQPICDLLSKVRSLGSESDEGFVFVRPDGRRYTGHDISCAASRRSAEAGIKQTSIHQIRRTVSSELNEVLPQKAVAGIMGHSEQVNERYYNYSLAENAEKKLALEKVFPFVPKSGGFS